MYMTDINTTLRGSQKKQEDPKKANVIVKKIFKGLSYIILGIAIITLSSWQLSAVLETTNCMGNYNAEKPCPYPTNENAPPYSSIKGKYDMDPFQAFLNIIMSTISGGLIGLSRGVKCCPKLPVATAVPVQSGGMKGGNSSNPLTKFNLQIGDTSWKPFDIYSRDIGWPYDAIKNDLPFGFNYWLGLSQMKSWSIPRQIVQGIFLFLANLMSPEIGEKTSWVLRLVITLCLPMILIIMSLLSWVASLFATIWGGFLQHIFQGNFAGCVWGFFCTWALIIYNIFVQHAEFLASLFIIPAISNPSGVNFIATNWSSMKNGGYREIILGSAFVSFIGVVLYAFYPLLSQ